MGARRGISAEKTYDIFHRHRNKLKEKEILSNRPAGRRYRNKAGVSSSNTNEIQTLTPEVAGSLDDGSEMPVLTDDPQYSNTANVFQNDEPQDNGYNALMIERICKKLSSEEMWEKVYFSVSIHRFQSENKMNTIDFAKFVLSDVADVAIWESSRELPSIEKAEFFYNAIGGKSYSDASKRLIVCSTKFAKPIMFKRLLLSMDAADLALKAGITTSEMRALEFGSKKPTEKIIESLCKELDIDLHLIISFCRGGAASRAAQRIAGHRALK